MLLPPKNKNIHKFKRKEKQKPRKTGKNFGHREVYGKEGKITIIFQLKGICLIGELSWTS